MADDLENLRTFVRTADEDDVLRKFLMRLFLAEKRRQISRAASFTRAPSTAERLNRKRFANAQAQKLRRQLLGSSRPPISKDVLAFRYGDHPVLSELIPDREKLWKPVLKRGRSAPPVVIKVPALSFLDDPVGAMEVLREIALAETHALSVRIDFEFEYVDDIGPFLLLAEIWPFFAPVFSAGGTMHAAVQKVVEAVGLRGSLGMAFPGLRDLRNVWALPVQRRRPTGRSRSEDRYLEPQTNEVVAGRVCDEVNRWLGAAGTSAELTPSGRMELSQIVNELLDNAERHSSFRDKDGSWTTAAFMARRRVGDEVRHVCHMAFVSLGDTICESLDGTAPDELRGKINGFVADMLDVGAEQERATLVTLAAIQDGVTRDPEAYKRKSGGYGFMEFVDSVNILGLSNREELRPRITILSGRSCISLRTPYIRGVRGPTEGPRHQYFNASNSIDEAPDSAFVQDLPIKLPGTVISVAFTLDPEFYRTTLNG